MSKKIIIEFSQKALKALIENENSCVTLHKSVYNLALYPYHLSDLNSSIRELLRVKFAKYEKELGGILLGYKNVKILSPQGRIVTDCCFIHLNIEADFYIFQPEIGATLNGIVNKKSKDHVGCLVHRVFNVSIPNRKEEEYWLGYNVKIGDEVLLQVIYLNLDAPLPYIRAKFLSAVPVENDADITDGNDIQFKQIKCDETFKKSEFSQNIDDINISGINEIESTPEKKKKHKLKKLSLDNIEVEDTVDTSFQNINIKTPKDGNNKKSSRKSSEINEQPTTDILKEQSPKEKKHKKSRKSLETIENMDTNETLNSTSNTLNNETPKEKKTKKAWNLFEINDIINENLNEESPKEKKHKKSRKSLETIESIDTNETLNSTSNILNNEIPKETKSKKAWNLFEINEESPKEKKHKKSRKSLETNETLNSTSNTLNNETPKEKETKKAWNLFEINDNINENLNEESPKEKKHRKSRKSLETIESMDTNETLNATSNTLNNETPKEKKSKKSRKSVELSDNIDKNLNASLTAEILNNVTPKDKKSRKSKIPLEVIDNSDQNINLSKTNSEITPKNKRKNTETDFNIKQIKAEIGATPKIKAEICATPKIKAETYVTPKVKKELGVTPKIKSEKRKSKTPVDNLEQSFKKEKSTPALSDQQELWATILHQMYDSELENTLGNSSKKSHKNDVTNTIESTETPKNKKRKHSLSDVEDSGVKRKKRKHSISEFQETALSIVSPKKKHKSKKTDK